MTSVPTTPFTYKSFPVCPGAYLVNSGYGTYPIFCSINNFDTICQMNNQDNYYIVMPGYRLQTYPSSGYAASSTTSYNGDFNNTDGAIFKRYNSVYQDHGSSCYLSYKGTPITVSGIS